MLQQFVLCTWVCSSIAWSAHASDSDWKLVWNDEFNEGIDPDPQRWGFWTSDEGNVNNELQFYTDRRENVRIENGVLVIEAKKEKYRNADYTSGMLRSIGSGSWTYGRFEIRAKLPTGRGMWPAIWMLPIEQNYGSTYWPDNGEIDIMEHVGFEPGRIYGTIHTLAFNHMKGTQKGAPFEVKDLATAFHVYSVEWTPEALVFSVDSQEFFKFDNTHRGWTEWPYDRPFQIYLNVAVGGDWGGSQGIDDSIFPQRMEIDSVRVYQSQVRTRRHFQKLLN